MKKAVLLSALASARIFDQRGFMVVTWEDIYRIIDSLPDEASANDVMPNDSNTYVV